MTTDPDNWYHLPYIKATTDTCRIDSYNDGYALFSLSTTWSDNVWFCTGWKTIVDLLSQYDYAAGRVLCTGLGLGIIPLLIQTKQEVNQIVVVEKDPNVIELFKLQKFKTDKITIVQSDALEYKDETPFDVILPDHYNELEGDEILTLKLAIDKIRENTNSPNATVVPFRWIEFTRDYGSISMPWGKKMGLPRMSLDRERRYIDGVEKALDQVEPLSSILQQINKDRA